MKILFPIGLFYPATVGGPSSTLYWHTCYLKKNNIENYIVTSSEKITNSHNIKINTWIQNEAGNVIYCKVHSKYFPLKAIWETLKKIPIVDVVHYSSAYYTPTIFTIFISILFRKKVFLSPRGEFFHNAIDNPFKRLVIKLYRIFQSQIIFHATSQDEYQIIQNLYPKSRIVIQPNFIDIHTSQKEMLSNKNIIFLGIIYSVKKIENLIQAVALSDTFMHSDSLLLIAGNPLVPRDFVYKDHLVELIKTLNLSEKVKFVGELFNNDKEQFLSDGYVLILPSESENFGNVVVEALSRSTPVIASTGTPWQILKSSNIGWWIENDPMSLKNAIDEALSLTESQYLIKCKASLQIVTEKFNINTSPENRWITIYEEL